MSLRSLLVNLVGLAFIVFCFYFVFVHGQYLNQSPRPNREAISKELDAIASAFQGSRLSEVEIFDKKSVYISARVYVNFENERDAILNGQRRLESRGWRKVSVNYGDIERYCKGDLVAELTPLETTGSYALQVNWGNADAVCKSK